MPATNVSWPIPLLRQRIFYPGQFGVRGTDSEEGIRTDTHGTVFYVDPNAAGVSDGRDGTDPRHPLETVGAALTHCQPYHGDVIAVMANNRWQYAQTADGRRIALQESVTVTVPGVRIVGINPSGQGVFWYPAVTGGTCITVLAIDVTIEGFWFSADILTPKAGDAIEARWGGTEYGDNLTVRYCLFDGTIDTAIEVDETWYCDIHHCVFQQCDLYGIYNAAISGGLDYSQIHNNWFMDCGTAAIALLAGAADNAIYQNWVYNSAAQGAAAATDQGIDTAAGGRNLVFDNWFSCLLPPAGVGDYADLNSASGTDAWINNHCMDGDAITNP